MKARGEAVDTMLTKLQYEFQRTVGRLGLEEITQLTRRDDEANVLEQSRSLLLEVMSKGILNFHDLEESNPELFTSGSVGIIREKAGKEEIPIESLITLENLQDWIEDRVSGSSLDDTGRSLVFLLVDTFSEVNGFYDAARTEAAQRKAQDEVGDVVRKLVKGQVLVRKGDIIGEEALVKIQAVGENTIAVNIYGLGGNALFLAIVFTLSVLVLRKKFHGASITRNQVYFLMGAGLTCLLISALVVQISWKPAWFPIAVLIPIGAIAMAITLIISVPAGIVSSALLALLMLPVVRMSITDFLFILLSGIAACTVVSNTEKRIDLVRAGLLLSLCNSVILIVLGFFQSFPSIDILVAIGWGVANGFSCGILTLGFLPIFEHFLNAATRFRLMELSDLNAPIFKKMLNLAPGTYHHSILVANLVESACTEIGANALLARVGAYYHDIGKIDQARYFIENQTDQNMHDDLKPSLSAAVIKSHVKIGVEKAKEISLPKEVIDVISQHHGKALISYFYQRALDDNQNKKQSDRVSADDFSYSGEWPRTKEAAAVMLGDAVEAVSRTLKKPTIARLEKMVWSIIMDKFTSGELNRSNLTFNDLDVIKERFVQVLAGFYHSRIEYPNQPEEDGS